LRTIWGSPGLSSSPICSAFPIQLLLHQIDIEKLVRGDVSSRFHELKGEISGLL
jgi:hypothetical protein